MTDEEAGHLRREITRREQGRGKKYPATLRLRAAAWLRAQIAAGTAIRVAAARIGIDHETGRRWLRLRQVAAAQSAAPQVKPVEVAGDSDADSDAEPGERRVAVVSPSGFRIEGLTLDEAASMLRVLG